MRIRILAAALAALTLPLTACSDSSDPKEASPREKPAASKSVDCEDPNLSQAEWIDNCQADPPDTHLKVGQSYTWADGVKTTVTKLERITGPYQQGDTKPSAKEALVRVHIAFSNAAEIPVKLDEFSMIVEGATSGGSAAIGTYQRGEEALEGRLASGGRVIKTNELILDKRYGDQVVVTVQRGSSNDEPSGYPEFTGTIVG